MRYPALTTAGAVPAPRDRDREAELQALGSEHEAGGKRLIREPPAPGGTAMPTSSRGHSHAQPKHEKETGGHGYPSPPRPRLLPALAIESPGAGRGGARGPAPQRGSAEAQRGKGRARVLAPPPPLVSPVMSDRSLCHGGLGSCSGKARRWTKLEPACLKLATGTAGGRRVTCRHTLQATASLPRGQDRHPCRWQLLLGLGAPSRGCCKAHLKSYLDSGEGGLGHSGTTLMDSPEAPEREGTCH